MQTRLKIKILKRHKKLFYIVVGLNKRSITSPYFDKLGVCFFKKNKKIIMLSLKKLAFWLTKGIFLSKFVSYIFAIIFNFYLKNKKNINVQFKNYNYNKNYDNYSLNSRSHVYNKKLSKILELKKNIYQIEKTKVLNYKNKKILN